MKTPDEIKKGLKYCGAMYEWDGSCTGCPYERNDGECDGSMETDAIAYIQQLESRLAQAERERDAAVGCIEKVYNEISKPVYKVFDTERNLVSSLHIIWDYLKEWRGVCEENTKDGADV